MVYQEEVKFSTQGHRDMHDLTAHVAEIVARSKIETGIVNICCVGSTAAVGAIEFEPGLQKDLPEMLDRLIPPSRQYGHSHLQATLLGPALTVPVTGGRPTLGTWQQIFHIECDVRPRQRSVVVTVLGE